MNRFLRWFFAVGGILFIIYFAFSLYERFLMDYSYENLEFAYRMVPKEMNPASYSPVTNRAYHGVVQDLVVDEAARENPDYKTVALLELASRSVGEAASRAGYTRARFYLHEAARLRLPARGEILRAADAAYRVYERSTRFLLSFFNYLQRRLFPTMAEMREQTDFSSTLLLVRAEERENKLEFDEAAKLYRRYLLLYPMRPDRGFVTISLSHILAKQRKYQEAERLLRGIQLSFVGTEEGRIASRLLVRINALRDHEARVYELLRRIAEEKEPPQAEALEFKLALEYLSSYRLANALEILKKLSEGRDPAVRQKAKFYLGLLYKFNLRLDEGAKVLEGLVREPLGEGELALGIEAQLADIYYQQHDYSKSASYYKTLSKSGEEQLSRKAASQIWVAISELEQAGLYYFELHDPAEGARHLERFGQAAPGSPFFGELRRALEVSSQTNLRELAFRALKARKVHLAFDLFNKHLNIQPRDAWANSGLATCYIIFADLNLALDYAEKGHGFKEDEYTLSLLAYVHGFYDHSDMAIRLYREAMKKAEDYIPARYNLACEYLNGRRYEEALVLLKGLAQSFSQVRNLMRSKILNNEGCAYWGLGDSENAAAKFQEALKIRPDFADAKENLALVASGEAPKAAA